MHRTLIPDYNVLRVITFSLLLMSFLLLAACDSINQSDTKPPDEPVQSTTSPQASGDETEYPERFTTADLLQSIVGDILSADDESLFSKQRTPLYKEIFLEMGGGLPGYPFEYSGITCTVYGDTDGGDNSCVTVRPELAWDIDTLFDESGGGRRITAIRRYGKAYIVDGSYVKGRADGEFTVRAQSDYNNQIVFELKLTTKDDDFFDKCTVNAYENGALLLTESTDVFSDMDMPVKWAGSGFGVDDEFWTVIGGLIDRILEKRAG
jgi:hypothetical protein